MKFADAESFAIFMKNPEISNEVKSRLLDAVAASSGRNFRNIL
jgi:F0F1-type ATP synthase delta subunit